MRTVKKGATSFDDDFEVEYEEEILFQYSFDTEPLDSNVTDETEIMDTDARQADRSSRPKPRNRFQEKSKGEYNPRDDYNVSDDYGAPDDYDTQNDYDYCSDTPQRKRARRKSAGGAQRLFFPVKKTAKYGTKAIYRTARAVIRIVSMLIFAGTLGVLAHDFWRGSAPYGDPQTILAQKNYALAAYAAVAALVLLFEFIAFLWSLTKLKIREGRKIYKEDTGRGLTSFIILYIASYLSFLLCSFLPDMLNSYAILKGIKGALDVFGSLHNVLLGLCLAGAVFCFIRRSMN